MFISAKEKNSLKNNIRYLLETLEDINHNFILLTERLQKLENKCKTAPKKVGRPPKQQPKHRGRPPKAKSA